MDTFVPNLKEDSISIASSSAIKIHPDFVIEKEKNINSTHSLAHETGIPEIKDEIIKEENDDDSTYAPIDFHSVFIPEIKIETEYDEGISENQHTNKQNSIVKSLRKARKPIKLSNKVKDNEINFDNYNDNTNDSIVIKPKTNGRYNNINKQEDIHLRKRRNKKTETVSINDEDIEENLNETSAKKSQNVKGSTENNEPKNNSNEKNVAKKEKKRRRNIIKSEDRVELDPKIIASLEANAFYKPYNDAIKGLKCSKCEKKFPTKSKLRIHERIHTGNKPHQCSHCNKTFAEEKELQKHEPVHLRKTEFQCNICLKYFATNSSLSAHIYTHTGEKQFMCSVCGKSFVFATYLKNHEKSHVDASLVCMVCGKMFKDKGTLSRHVKAHSGFKRYRCKMCVEQFSSYISYKAHEFTHTGIKPFKCKYCPKTFSYKANIKSHERVHTGEKPFKCRHCDKAFTVSHTLRRHEASHTGDKLYACDECDKSYYTHSRLLEHQNKHKGIKPFKCSVCYKSFTYHRSLSAHMKYKNHNKEGITV